MSDSENDLFGDEATSPARAPSPAGSSKAAGEDGDGADLFGDDEDRGRRSPSTTPARSRSLSHVRSRSRSRGGSRSRSRTGMSRTPNPLEYPEDEDEVEETREQWGNLPLPKWPHLSASDGKVWLMKLPAFVNVEARPFDADLYAEQLDEAPVEGTAAKGRMIGVRNTVRWRWVHGVDGPERQSNARMLRWSDGSVSLQLGEDLYDVQPSYGTTLAREDDKVDDVKPGSQALSQSASQNKPAATSTTPKGAPSGSTQTEFVCFAAAGEQVLVTEAALEGRLTLVPTSMDSKTHRELVKHVGSQHVKHSRMKILDDIGDREKVAELLARTAPQRVRPRVSRPRNPSAGGSSAQNANARRRANARRGRGESDSDAEDLSRRDRERDYDEHDGFVVADTDEEDQGYSDDSERKSSKKKSKGKRRERSEDLDETELADRRIEELERERKRKRQRKDKDEDRRRSRAYATTDEEDAEGEDEEDIAMDVESEEE